ncbi:MAG: 5-formyltetrahydrofolate cyclo-ligase [Ectothiorhodospiraceae bacterium]|nr:5-formyltetrahydrofolate cyclo-ligase [Ectothiorhodospiraceae bacterium]MCH8505614.1 5-formyltetrahydrofolate cyclo-ligase [Ectothiorhodospiraceae bacterium]
MPSRQQLRQHFRELRRGLSEREQHAAAERLCRLAMGWRPFRRARHIALYLPNDGEIDPTPLIRAAWAMGKRVSLPVLRPFTPRGLWFVDHRPGQAMRPNRYGIPEPDGRMRRTPLRELDLILTPLVAFDGNGNRLGMGAGYYDRCLAPLQRHPGWRKPRLVGLAHQVQQADSLPEQPWDVPMAAVITDRGIILPR